MEGVGVTSGAPNPQFWRGRRVLITGHTGFKGGWLAHWLKRAGADVFGYSMEPPSQPSLFAAAGIAGELQHWHGDIRDLPSLQVAVAEISPEIVFHMAAQPLVRPSYDNPVDTFSTNVMGTLHVLEASKRAGVRGGTNRRIQRQ